MAANSISTGTRLSDSACTTRPSSVANTGNWKKRAETASDAAATIAPRVSTVQYTRKRVSMGRVERTRQMLLKVASMLLRVISREMIRAITPAAVSSLALVENCCR